MYVQPQIRTVTILSGATTSAAFCIGPANYATVGVHLTGALTGATLGFTASPTEGGTYATVKDSDGNAVSIPSNAAGAIGMSGAEAFAILSWQWVKAVSASSEGADRTITIVLK